MGLQAWEALQGTRGCFTGGCHTKHCTEVGSHPSCHPSTWQHTARQPPNLQEDDQLLQEGGQPVGALPQQLRHIRRHLHASERGGSSVLRWADPGCMLAATQRQPAPLPVRSGGWKPPPPTPGVQCTNSPAAHLCATQRGRHKLARLFRVEGLEHEVQREGLQGAGCKAGQGAEGVRNEQYTCANAEEACRWAHAAAQLAEPDSSGVAWCSAAELYEPRPSTCASRDR